MLNRIKKMLKKENGFTLVELLAVIVILGIILAIAIPTIGNVIGNSKDKAHVANVELIENAAKLAALSDNASTADYKLEDLEKDGFLEKIPESVNGKEYEKEDVVEVKNSMASYSKFRAQDGSIK